MHYLFRENVTNLCISCADLPNFPWKYVHLEYEIKWKLISRKISNVRVNIVIFTHFWQKFRESNSFTKKLLNKWFDEIFFQWEFSVISTLHSEPQCGNDRIYLSLRFYVKSMFWFEHLDYPKLISRKMSK